jgi:hypothetical protein
VARSFILALLMLVSLARADAQPVSVVDEASLVTLDNGLLRLVIDRTTGRVRSFEAMLQGEFVRLSDPARANALYVDWNGSSDATTGEQKARAPRAGYGGPSVRLNRVTVAEQTPDAATVIINAGPTDFFPFNVQFHLRLARGEPMLYAWVVYTHEPDPHGAEAFGLRQPVDRASWAVRGGGCGDCVIGLDRRGRSAPTPLISTSPGRRFDLLLGSPGGSARVSSTRHLPRGQDRVLVSHNASRPGRSRGVPLEAAGRANPVRVIAPVCSARTRSHLRPIRRGI